ncbi:unnamed protein product [Spodoptera exigua]|nr:unnamed protein product [Spodoptera exigua]
MSSERALKLVEYFTIILIVTVDGVLSNVVGRGHDTFRFYSSQILLEVDFMVAMEKNKKCKDTIVPKKNGFSDQNGNKKADASPATSAEHQPYRAPSVVAK